MGGTSSTYSGDEKYIEFYSTNLKVRGHLEDADVDGNIILKNVPIM